MSNKVTRAKKETYKKEQKQSKKNSAADKAVNAMNKFETATYKIGEPNKYRERIITSYICIVLYIVMFFIYTYLMQDSAAYLYIMIAICIVGAGACVFNIVKSAWSINDNKQKKHNIVLIIIQSIFCFLFIGLMF